MMFDGKFWKATAERAIRTFAQALAAAVGADAAGILDVDWGQASGVAGLAAILSVLTAVAASGVGSEGPSFTDAESTNK